MQSSLTIRPAPRAAVLEALKLVYRRLPPEKAAQYVEVLCADIRAGEVSAEGLLTAWRDRRLVGAVFAQLQPGNGALLWPPRTVPREPPETVEQLLAAVCQWLACKGARVANALMEKVDRADDALLRGGGFAPLAQLLYLVSSEIELPASPPEGPLEFEPYNPENHMRLTRVVEATYERSLDCPGLDGLRNIEEILAGYQSTGTFSPERWLIVRHEGRDVGCLLLADHPEDENWELVYMGLVASARGHGWGKKIVRHAQWLTRQAGRSCLVVAVDAANRPAVDMYAATGFRAWDRRTVYVKTFALPENSEE